MKSRFGTYIAAVTLCVALPIPVSLAEQDPESPPPQHYKLNILPTPGGTFGEAWAVNNGAAMTGHSTLSGDETYHAFFWQKGVITDLGTLGGPNSMSEWKPATA
jgi:probable HAF family extracellular repeat protein